MALQRVVNGGIDPAAIRPQEELLRPRAPGERGGAARPGAGGATVADLPRIGRRAESGWEDVPAGTDPQVWLGLSVEERAYFARMEAAGPLSYGPQAAGEAVMYRGRYLNIKV